MAATFISGTNETGSDGWRSRGSGLNIYVVCFLLIDQLIVQGMFFKRKQNLR